MTTESTLDERIAASGLEFSNEYGYTDISPPAYNLDGSYEAPDRDNDGVMDFVEAAYKQKFDHTYDGWGDVPDLDSASGSSSDQDLSDGPGLTIEEIESYDDSIVSDPSAWDDTDGLGGLLAQMEEEGMLSGFRADIDDGVLRLGGAIDGTFYGDRLRQHDSRTARIREAKQIIYEEYVQGESSGQSWGEWTNVDEADEVTVPNEEMADDVREEVWDDNESEPDSAPNMDSGSSTGETSTDSDSSTGETPSDSDSSSTTDSPIPVVGLAAALLVAAVLYQMSDS